MPKKIYFFLLIALTSFSYTLYQNKYSVPEITVTGWKFSFGGNNNYCSIDDVVVDCKTCSTSYQKHIDDSQKCAPCWLTVKDYNDNIIKEGLAIHSVNQSLHHQFFGDYSETKNGVYKTYFDSDYNIDSVLNLQVDDIRNFLYQRGKKLHRERRKKTYTNSK